MTTASREALPFLYFRENHLNYEISLVRKQVEPPWGITGRYLGWDEEAWNHYLDI
jgi:hypothetical protein